MIAMALACEPRTADRRRADDGARRHDPGADPRALDDLQRELGMAVLLITHDLGVVAQHRRPRGRDVRGRIVEQATTVELFAQPMHPYTRGLLASIPRRATAAGRLNGHPRLGAALTDLPAGCAFAPAARWRPLAAKRCAPTLVAACDGRHGRLPRGRRRWLIRMSLLSLVDLRVTFPRRGGVVRAVDGVARVIARARPSGWSASRAAASPPSARRRSAARAGDVGIDPCSTGHDIGR
jgi:oligopeptide/dipeptide ABC transporter ATP-binding protein